MAERLRLEAEMKDSATPEIRKLKAELVQLQEATKEGRSIAKLNKELQRLRAESAEIKATPGMREAEKWFRTSSDAAANFVKSGGGAAGVINSMGIGGLAAAASLGGLVASLKEMSDRSLEMKELGRETGLTVDQINAFGHAGQSFGVGADSMRGAISHLAGQMPEFRRNYGAMFNELSRWPDLIKKLQADGPEDQIKDIFKFLGQEKLQNEPQLQKQILGSIFGNGDEMEKLFARGSEGFLKELERQKQQLGAISPEMLRQAQDLRDSQIKFNDSLEKFETTVGPAFLGGLSSILKTATNVIDALGAIKDKIDGKEPTAQERLDDLETRRDLKPKTDNPFATGKSRLFKRSAYIEGGDSDGGLGDDSMADSVRKGFLAAFRELMANGDTRKSGGGLIQTSYEGGGTFGDGTGGRAFGGSGRARGAVDDVGPMPSGSRAGNLTRLTEDEARRAGIDPRVMHGIRAGESGHSSAYDHNDKGEDSWGPWQLNRHGGLGNDFERDTAAARRAAGYGGLEDPRTIPMQTRWVAEYLKKHGRGALRNWHGYHGDRDASSRWGDSGYRPVAGAHDIAGAHTDPRAPITSGPRGSASLPNVPVGASYGGHIGGQLAIDGQSFRFGSGGAAGSSSIPYGDYKITPGAVGPWGQAHGAIGIEGGHIYDKALGRMREGIELHSGHTAELITHGCLAFEKAMWPKVKDKVQGMIKSHGAAYLHVGPHGASISPRRAEGLPDVANAPPSQAPGGKHHLDVHIRDPGGMVTSASFRHGGHEGTIRGLTRWPQRRIEA